MDIMPSANRTSTIQDDILEILTEFDTFLDNVFESPLSSPNSDTSDHNFIPTVYPTEGHKDINDELERLQNFENAQKFFKGISNEGNIHESNSNMLFVCDKKDSKGHHNDGNLIEDKKFLNAHNNFKLKKEIIKDGIPVNFSSEVIQLSPHFPLDLRDRKVSPPRKMTSKGKEDNFKHGQCSPPTNFVKFSECLRLPVKPPLDSTNIANMSRLHRLEKRDISSPILIDTTIPYKSIGKKENEYSSSAIQNETRLPDEQEKRTDACSMINLQKLPLPNKQATAIAQDCKILTSSFGSHIIQGKAPATLLGKVTSLKIQALDKKTKAISGQNFKSSSGKEIKTTNVTSKAVPRTDAPNLMKKYSKSKLSSAGNPLAPIFEGNFISPQIDFSSLDIPLSTKLGMKHNSSPVVTSQVTKYDKVIGELNISHVSCHEISTSFTSKRPKSVSIDRIGNDFEGLNYSGRRSGSMPRSRPESILPSKPKNCNQSRSESVPRINPENIVQSITESVPRSNPENLFRSRPQIVPRSNPDNIIQPKSKSIICLNPDNRPIIRSRPGSVPRSYPDNIPSRPQIVPHSNLGNIIQSRSESVPRSNPDNIIRSRPESIPRSNPANAIKLIAENNCHASPKNIKFIPVNSTCSYSKNIAIFGKTETISQLDSNHRPCPILNSERVPRSRHEINPRLGSASNSRSRSEYRHINLTCSGHDNAPRSKPESAPLSKSENTPRSEPESTPVSVPESTPRSWPEKNPPTKPPRSFIDEHEDNLHERTKNIGISESDSHKIGIPEDIFINIKSFTKTVVPDSKCESKNLLTSFRVLPRNSKMVVDNKPCSQNPVVPSNLRTSALQIIPSSVVQNEYSEKNFRNGSGTNSPSTFPLISHEEDSCIDQDEYISYIHGLLSSHSAKIAAGIMSMEHRGTKALELWSRRVTQGYEGVNVSNMTTSWRDGLAFCALIHHFRPDLIDFKSLKAEKILENNALAFRVAEQHLGIPALLDAEDMVETSIPDRLSILTYVSQFYQAFNAQGLIGPGGRLSPLAANNAKNINPSKIPLNHKSPIPSPIVLTKTASKAQPISQPPATLQTKTEKEFKTDKVTAGVRGRREICTACNKTVFLAERLAVGFPGQLRHRTCFRCDRCSAQLTLASYYETEKGQFCCETCPDEERAISSGDEGDGSVLQRENISAGNLDESSSSDSESDSDESVESADDQPSEHLSQFEKSISPEPSAEARSVFLKRTLEMDESEKTSIHSLQLSPSPMMQESETLSLPPELLLPLPSSPPPPKPARSSLNFSQDDKESDITPSLASAQPPSSMDTNECLSGLSRCDYTKSKETTPPSNVLDTGQTILEHSTSNNFNLNHKILLEQDLNNKENKDYSYAIKRQIDSDLCQNIMPEEPKDASRNGPQVASIRVIFENNSKVAGAPNDSESKIKVPKLERKDKVAELPPEKYPNFQTSKDREPNELSINLAVSSNKGPDDVSVEQVANYDKKSFVLKNVYAKDSVHIDNPPNVPSIDPVPSESNLSKEYLSQVEEANPFDSFSDVETTEKTKSSNNINETTEEYNNEKCSPISDKLEPLNDNGKYGKAKDEKESEYDEASFENKASKLDLMQRGDASEAALETSVEGLNYPIELNPFDEDIEETPEQRDPVEQVGEIRETKSLEDFESQGASKKTIKAPLNPFDSEDDAIANPEIGISKLKLNPFWSDDESDSSASTPSKKKIKPPRPPPPTLRRDVIPPSKNRKLILPNSGLVTPPSPSLSNRSSSSDQSTFRLKKKQRHAPAPPSLYISPFLQSNNSLALQNNLNPSGEACAANDPISRKMQKDLQNRTNKMMGSAYNKDVQNTATALSGMATPKSEKGEWRRKKGPAPLRPVPQKRAIRKLPMRQIQQELYDIEVKQTELERQGVLLETVIREKTEGSVSGSSGDDSLSLSTTNSEVDKSISSLASNNSDGSQGVEVEDMILQLFELVNEKNELFRRQTELMYLKREKRLEEEYAELEYQIRCLMLKPQSEKSEIEISQEEELIGRLVKVVEQRDQVVNCLEMERQREALEDESIASHMIKYQEKHIEGIESDGKEPSKKKKKKKLRLLKKKKKGKNKEKEEKVDADKDVDETEVKKEKKKKRNWFKIPNLDKSQ